MDLKNTNNKEFEKDNNTIKNMSKVINSFVVVSINPLLTHAKAKKPNEINIIKPPNSNISDKELSSKKLTEYYIDHMDVIKNTSMDTTLNTNNNTTIEIAQNKEKWIRLSKTSDFWLRMFYTKKYNRQNGPITMIKEVECEVLNSEYIVSYSK